MNTDKIYAESIANEYAHKDTSKVVALKKLDRKAKSRANIFGYTFGTISALVLGVGMTLSMGEIGGGTKTAFIWGIVVGLLGILGVSINYPIYKKILDKDKRRYAYDIMTLAKEISEAE